MQKLFGQPQWQEINFGDLKYNMSIAPWITDEAREDILHASKSAGIEAPVLPGDIDNRPAGAKYYCAAVQEQIDENKAYELRFYALADQYNESLVYSIWVSAVPLELTDTGYMTSAQEFIFSVNDTPEIIRKAIAQYFETNEG